MASIKSEWLVQPRGPPPDILVFAPGTIVAPVD
jgi:hypothetical protein